MSELFKSEAEFQSSGTYGLYPFRFFRLDDGRYAIVNEVGEWEIVSREILDLLVHKLLPQRTSKYRDLKAKHFLHEGDDVGIDLLTLKARTKRDRIADFTSLFMFVVTLRCNHTCAYCQVSRQTEDRAAFDMTPEIAEKALNMVFQSPAPSVKIEIQGGESLLNFPLICYIVTEAINRNVTAKKNLAFVIATNLSILSDDVLTFCRQYDITISTSLDGPAELHNANRVLRTGDSHQSTIDAIARARTTLGHHNVSALMTTTQQSLPRVKDIINEYVQRRFSGIFLRSLSPYGFAVKTGVLESYNTQQWLTFYKEGLDYIIELNKQGVPFTEYYTTLILQKMFSPYGTSFVNLQSPAGMGIAGLVFNYNGEVYPSDEARMTAEMGDKLLCMGHVLRDPYEKIMLSPALLTPLDESVAECVPGCSECAFLPYCGCDPDYHYATQGDFVGHKTLSGFCQKNTGIFEHLLKKLNDDLEARRILESWIHW